AYKSGLREGHAYTVDDEGDMILTGYLAFLDPPKPSAAPAIKALLEHGVQTKILTGDNEKVTQAVCEKVGLDINQMLLGSEIDQMSDQE
ncbi:HAD family hydrolase, partial [Streptococcus mitis]